ncbi:hypothetical protein [Hyphobacterium marinum]|uniref:Uncharacterized protein n=1 Tax=Hyphobacterium marinum TaxID=3116574 RepID=A0ABU7LY40_9PROT|nr:hypothetical protein [Hyphobacterium sp. Y6023]MEE2565920.1 hypothetical protein [Hyphobacterium sp. Y6023]
MDRQQKHHIPDAPPETDESEAYDPEKYASRRDQSRPDRGLGFVPVDEAIHQGELFGEAVETAARDRQTAAGEGAEMAGENSDTETEAAMKETIGKKREKSKYDDPAPEDHDNEDVEEALKETFPASDPASYSPGTATPSNIKDKDKKKSS